jgi:hypothetical protein
MYTSQSFSCLFHTTCLTFQAGAYSGSIACSSGISQAAININGARQQESSRVLLGLVPVLTLPATRVTAKDLSFEGLHQEGIVKAATSIILQNRR